MPKQNQKKDQGGMGIGTAALALAAAAAGAYFLYGAKDAAKNRKKVKGWMLKAKGEVLEGLEKMKANLTEEAYYKIVDSVVSKYGSVKNASSGEVNDLRSELRSHWKNIKKHLTTIKTVPVKRKTKRSSKKK